MVPQPQVSTDDDDESAQPDDSDDVVDTDADSGDDVLDDLDDVDDGETEPDADDGDTDDDDVDTADVDMPDDDGRADDDSSGGSLLSGSTLGISNKVLFGLGVAAITVVILLRYYEVESTTQSYDEERIEEETSEARETTRGQREPNAPAGYDEEMNQQAINEVFGPQQG